MKDATGGMHPAYAKPCIRTLEGEEMCDLLGPAQGYAVGTLPVDILSTAGPAGTSPTDFSNR